MKNVLAVNLGLLLLRSGIGIVFVVFGLDKLPHPTNWLMFIPSLVPQIIERISGLTTYQFLRVQGIIEAILGLQLLFGILSRETALCCATFLSGIIYAIGFEQIGIRDLGLFFSSVAILCLGGGEWSIEAWLNRLNSKQKDFLPNKDSM